MNKFLFLLIGKVALNCNKLNQQITSKEKILKKVRAALTFKAKGGFQNIDLDSNVFVQPTEDSLVEAFAKNFTATQAQFVFCDNQFDCIDKLLDLMELKKWKALHCKDDALEAMLKDAGITLVTYLNKSDKIPVAITGCESIIARTGSILFSSVNTRTNIIWPNEHVVIAKLSQLVPDIKDAMQMLKNRHGRNFPSSVTFVTGPSKTLKLPADAAHFPVTTTGALGPHALYLFLIDDTKKF